jgi:hypothetical protein
MLLSCSHVHQGFPVEESLVHPGAGIPTGAQAGAVEGRVQSLGQQGAEIPTVLGTIQAGDHLHLERDQVPNPCDRDRHIKDIQPPPRGHQLCLETAGPGQEIEQDTRGACLRQLSMHEHDLAQLFVRYAVDRVGPHLQGGGERTCGYIIGDADHDIDVIIAPRDPEDGDGETADQRSADAEIVQIGSDALQRIFKALHVALSCLRARLGGRAEPSKTASESRGAVTISSQESPRASLTALVQRFGQRVSGLRLAGGRLVAVTV